GGGLTDPANGYFKVGNEMGPLIHQAGLSISTFPQTFSSTGFVGSSDARKMKEVFTNSEPARPVCDCATSDVPAMSTAPSNQDTGYGSVYTHDGEARQQSTDASIPGRLDWQQTVSYRSGVMTAGAMGHNWTFNYQRHLIGVNAENLTELRSAFPLATLGDVVRLDGYNRADIYVHNSGGTYTSPNGFF